MKKLLKFLKGYRIKTVTGPLLKLVEAVCELIVPLVVANMIDEGIPAGRAGDYSLLVQGGVLLLVLGVVGLVFSLVAQFFASRASLGYGTNLRAAMFRHINTFSHAEINKFSSSSLTTRLTSDVNQTQNAVAMFIRLVTRIPFIVVGATIMALIIDVKLSFIFIVAGTVVGVFPFLIMHFTAPGYKSVQQSMDEVSLKTRESLSGARIVRAFNRQDSEKAQFKGVASELARKSIKVNIVSSILNPLTYALVNAAIICIMFFGSKQVYYGSLTQGEIIALVNYLTQILHALIVFANLFIIFSKASASAHRINEILDTAPSHDYGTGAEFLDSAALIFANNLTFSYEGSSQNSLEGISFELGRGQSLGIIGGTGSGKTTLINLLLNSYKTERGMIKIKGAELSDLNSWQVSAVFGVVPQKAILLSGTLRDNMRIAREDATDDEIIAALKSAQAYEFVSKLGNGLDTRVEQGGKNFSGGQQQRLSIARALLKQPEILILDDASSALDFATDAKLRRAIKKLSYSPAVINVSQRATSLKSSDFILVLDEGRAVGFGKHRDLLENCEIYREIYSSQDKGDEQ